MNVCIYVYVCMYVCMYIYVYVHMYVLNCNYYYSGLDPVLVVLYKTFVGTETECSIE